MFWMVHIIRQNGISALLSSLVVESERLSVGRGGFRGFESVGGIEERRCVCEARRLDAGLARLARRELEVDESRSSLLILIGRCAASLPALNPKLAIFTGDRIP